MAIGIRSNAPVEYISTTDSALDTERVNLQRYFESFDRKHLPCREGAEPTVFKLRRLSRKQYIAIAGMPEEQRAMMSVAYGVVGIENFYLPNGNRLIPQFVDQGSEDQRLAPETLNDTFIPAVYAELAQVIQVLSSVDPLSGRRSGHSPG